jgi:exonuclease SbcC
MRAISKEGYLKLEGLNTELSRLKTSMRAGKIALMMTTGKPMELKVKKDFEEETTCSLASGQPLELSAGGQIQLGHSDWTMKVKSGEMDFDRLSAHFDQVSRDDQELLKNLGVGDFEEGKKAYESYLKQNGAVETLKDQLNEALEGETYEELESFAILTSQALVGRPVAEIAKEIGEINGKVDQTQRDAESKNRKLMEWEKDYKSKDQLLDLLLEKRGELKIRKEALNNLKPLPEGVTSPEGFVSEFEKKQETLKKKEKDLSEKRITRAELENTGPDETKEEIEIRWKEAKRRFEQVEGEGKAISEILETFEKIKKSMDEQTLDPWMEELQKVVAPLTLNRYTRIHLEKNTPDGAERPDGLEIPLQALSMGTKVGLGLALRLSMAGYFLKDLEGFLILDDPMVDMDPERQRAAAEVVRGFSKDKQVILFTCHPHHAEMLGGNLIRLD